MKIVHIIIGLNAGGAELMLKRLVLHHRTMFAGEHSVVSLTEMGVIGKELLQDGVEVHALGLRGLHNLPLVIYQLYRLLKLTRPDVVQTWMYHADLLGGVVARLLGIRAIIWGVRSTDIGKGGSRVTRIVRFACALLSGFIPRAIVCAAQASCVLHAALGYRKEAMVVIPNGFDLAALQTHPDDVAAVRASFGFETDAVVIGTVARFNRVKGVDLFVEAAAFVAARFPQARFVLIGRGMDADNGVLVKLIMKTGFPERFRLLGERRDVPVCLAALDVYCMPSRSEGFPNVVGEAMAVATPVVATDVGDAAFLIGKDGLIVAPENAHTLADGLLRMIAMPVEARRALGLRAQNRLREEFSMGRCVERFEQVYRETAFVHVVTG